MNVSVSGRFLVFRHSLLKMSVRRGVGRLSPREREIFVEELKRLLRTRPKGLEEINFRLTSFNAFEAYFRPIYKLKLNEAWRELQNRQSEPRPADAKTHQTTGGGTR